MKGMKEMSNSNEQKIINGDSKFRVYNRCSHSIGVVMSNGILSANVKPGSFVMLSVNDILYIESICNRKKFFSMKMLVPVDENGNELTLEQIGGFTDASVEPHRDPDEIMELLNKPFASFKAWITKVDDPVELHEIWEVGKIMDLPASKLKLLQSKMPARDLLGEEASEEK